MDRLKQLLHRIHAQLGLLTVSQRIAIALCATLLAVSVLWLLQWSTEPDMVPVLSHRFTMDELMAAESALKTGGYDYEIRGSQVYVRTSLKHEAIRVLHSEKALPDGSLVDMASVVAENNPFRPPQQQEFIQNYAKGNELAKIISTYPFVKNARVMISPRSKRRFYGEGDVPTASVSIDVVHDTELGMEMVNGMARLVSGAVQGLKPHNVTVTDARTGRSFSPPHPSEAVAMGRLDEVKKREDRFERKILNKLSYIPGVRTTVTVELDTDRISRTVVKHDKPQVKSEETLEQENQAATTASESATHANTGTALAAAPTGQTATTAESKTEFYEPKVAQTEQVESMPYAISKITATVSIPRSFIVGLYRAKHGEEEEPSDEVLAAEQGLELDKVKSAVQRIVMARAPEDVQVDVYPDIQWSEEGGSGWSDTPYGIAAAEGTRQADTMALLKGYGPQAGLALMGLMSLLMMMRIARKSAREVPDLYSESGEEEDSDRVLSVGPHAVGEAEMTDSFLTGKEVDERTLQDQQLSQEVARMVEADPKGAADLLRRWVDEED